MFEACKCYYRNKNQTNDLINVSFYLPRWPEMSSLTSEQHASVWKFSADSLTWLSWACSLILFAVISDFSPFKGTPIDFAGLCYVKQRWPMTTSVSSLHLQHIFSPLCGPFRHQTALTLSVCSGKGGKLQNQEEEEEEKKDFGDLFWWHSSWNLFFICQSAKWHYTSLSPSLFAYSSYLSHERPRQPPIRRRRIIVRVFPRRLR